MTGTDRKRRIVQASLQLFSEFGCETVSLEEIAFMASVKLDELKLYFADKDAIVLAVLDSIPEILQHVSATREELREMLKEEDVEHLLMRYVSAFYWQDDAERLQVYRFLYMEQYRDERVKAVAYDNLIHIPVQNIMCALDNLAALGAIPPCDSRALAEIWTRTSLVFSMQDAHNDLRVSAADYKQAMGYVVRLAARGVHPLPVEQVDLQWMEVPLWSDLEVDPGDTRQRILFEAFELFSEHGYHNVSMQGIAERMGLEICELYGHYGTKAEILQRFGEIMLDRYKQYATSNPAFRAVINERDPEHIALLISSAYPPARGEYVVRLNRMLFRDQFLSEPIKDIFVGNIYREIKAVEDMLEELVRMGRVRPMDCHHHAVVFVHTMCSFSVGETVRAKDMEWLDELRLRVAALLTSAVMKGFVNR